MKKLFIFRVLSLFPLFAFFSARSATVDTVVTYSSSMKKNIKAVVIKPDRYAHKEYYPVVYLLHGYSDAYDSWIKQVPSIGQYADDYGCIIVCPDGNYSSWYLDSPVDSTSRFETYISLELVSWIDTHYSTIRNAGGRAITGLSMGGHGALYLAFRHQDIFGAAGSMSGGVDLRPFPKNWEIAKKLGSYSKQPDNWEKNSVVNLTYLLTSGSLAILIDCGTEDFFYRVNQQLHEKLLDRNIAHDYISRPGDHSWTYWTNAIQYQMLFMHTYFEKKKNIVAQ